MRRAALVLGPIGGVLGILGIIAILVQPIIRFGVLPQIPFGFWVVVLAMLLASAIGIARARIFDRLPVIPRVVAECVQLFGAVCLILWGMVGVSPANMESAPPWITVVFGSLLLGGILLLIGAILYFLAFRNRRANSETAG